MVDMQQAVDKFPVIPCHLVNKIKFLSVQLTLASLYVHIPCACHIRYGTQMWVWVDVMLPNKKILRLTNLVDTGYMKRMLAVLDSTILEGGQIVLCESTDS